MQPELTNDQRPFLGLRPVLAHWQRQRWQPGTIIYHDELAIRKVVSYFSSAGPEAFAEADYDIFFTPEGLLRTASGRGKPRAPTVANLEKYYPTGYKFFFDGATTFATSARGGAIVPLRVQGNFASWAAATQWLAGFMARQLPDFPPRLTARLLAPLPKVSFRPGDIVAYQLSNDAGYGFCRILLDVNNLRATPWVANPLDDSGYHYLNRHASPMTIAEVLLLQKTSPTLSPAEIAQAARHPPVLLGDSGIRCGFLPIVAHQPVVASDLANLPQALEPLWKYGPRGYYYQWGVAAAQLPVDEELAALHEAVRRAFPARHHPLAYFDVQGEFFYKPGQFKHSLGPGEVEDYDLRHPSYQALRHTIMRKLGLPPTCSYDDFSRHCGYPTAQELIDWQATQPPSPDKWKWPWR
jgi:hypothetical protein